MTNGQHVISQEVKYRAQLKHCMHKQSTSNSSSTTFFVFS